VITWLRQRTAYRKAVRDHREARVAALEAEAALKAFDNRPYSRVHGERGFSEQRRREVFSAQPSLAEIELAKAEVRLCSLPKVPEARLLLAKGGS